MPEKDVLVLSHQELADIRHLISIAVWIRGEQVDNSDVALMKLEPTGIDSTLPPLVVNNDLLNVRRSTQDRDIGIAWWRRLTSILVRSGNEKLGPSWHKPEDLQGG